MPSEAIYRQSYNSFSGVDIHVVADGHILGEIQGLSYTVTREKAPLYTMGSADPRSFSRGKRGIAGSMIFLVFDRSALLDRLQEGSRYIANRYELDKYASASATNIADVNDTEVFGEDVTTAENGTVGSQTAGVRDLITLDKVIARARYHDQIPPFDIVLVASNEYGHAARMMIVGVEIMNTGSGLSVDDITTDESCTFVATSMIPWHRQLFVDPKGDGRISPASGPAPQPRG